MKTLISFLFIMLLFIGCSSSREIGSERIVEKSGDKPDWINSISTITDEFVLIRGIATGVEYQEDGILAAQLYGLRELGNLAGTYITTEGGLINTGQIRDQGGLTNAIRSMVNVSSKATYIYNLYTPEVYSEKVEKTTNTGVEYKWNINILSKIAKNDFDRIVNKLAEDAIDSLKVQRYYEAVKILEKGQDWINKKIGK